MTRTTSTIMVLGLAVALAGGCATAPGPFERGVALYNNGRYARAVGEFSEAIRLDPGSAAAYTNRGIARVRMGQIEAAIEDYGQAMRLKPNDPAIYFDRGNALVAGGQYGPAIADFTRAIELSPGFARAWFNRGTALWRDGQSEAARRDWQRGIAIEGDPWAQMAMRRSVGLESLLAPASTPPTEPAPPAIAAPAPPPAPPSASPPSPQSIDARALATRGISRELDGDREGALRDLRAALAIEPDPIRRASLENLLRMLESPP